MVSRRNYFTITIVMFILFLLFQFTNVVLESWKGYEQLSTRSTAYETDGKEGGGIGDETRRRVIYIGGGSEPIGMVVYNWAVYTKREIHKFGTIEEDRKSVV